jgi:hypothetical protein
MGEIVMDEILFSGLGSPAHAGLYFRRLDVD